MPHFLPEGLSFSQPLYWSITLCIALCSALLFSECAWSQWSTNWESWISSFYSEPRASVLNPGNHLLEIPRLNSELELRPELKWQDSDWFMVGRFRGIFSDERIYFTNEFSNSELSNNQVNNYDLQKGQGDITDLYIGKLMAEGLSLTGGLQNYQWGPGELYSPSNIFFHFNTQQKGFLYKEKGQVLLKIQKVFSDKSSLDLLIEPISNGTAKDISEQNFTPLSTLRFEKTEAEDLSMAFLIGQGRLRKDFLGVYGTYYESEGASFYWDGRLTVGAQNYSPQVVNQSFVQLAPAEISEKKLQGFYLIGQRFEGKSFDLRLEYLRNEAGFSSESWQEVLSALTNPSPYQASNIFHFMRSGLEFLRQDYIYCSLRLPDLGKHRDMNFYWRNLYNLDDQSFLQEWDLERNWSDSTIIYLELQIFQGAKWSEFQLSETYSVGLGSRIIW